jgi:putative transposase
MTISFARHSSACGHPAPRLAVMRFTLSYRDVEDLLAERGVDVSDETVRRWVLKSGRSSPENFTVNPISIRWP